RGHDGVLVGAPYVVRGGRARAGAARLYTARRPARR
ncbi:MAG: hypothetical protein JWN32_893, partial [Solirubrobacterales bacterium]|nr:hypothetical protein [Solirubrobacterales bacterium]